MYVILVLLVLFGSCRGEYETRCSDRGSGLTLVAKDHGVKGQYTVEWCTQADKNVTKWYLTMYYYRNRAPEKCRSYNVNIPRGLPHSMFTAEDIDTDLNCTNICFKANLDLIFNATCYHVKTFLYRGNKSSSPHDSLHYITDSIDSSHFTKSESRVDVQHYPEEVVLNWYLGYIPASVYTMSLCTNNTVPEECEDVSGNCSSCGPTQVCCRLAPRAACVRARLQHRGPWIFGHDLFHAIINADYPFCRGEWRPAPESEVAGSSGVWAACGGLGGAGLAGALLAAGLRRRRAARRRRAVLSNWLHSTEGEGKGELSYAAGDAGGRILLMYARDCKPAMRVAAALKLLLQNVTHDKVYDIFSSDVVAAAAAAPAEWVRGLLARPDVRVVLLHTPALPALYTTRLQQTLQRPLLGHRAWPRTPHAGDPLLLLALRALALQDHHLPYHKYFVAKISNLEPETDVAPEITPMRRYLLPAAAATLLHDLRPPCPAGPPGPPCPPGQLQELERAVVELQQYVRDNPNYLADELVFQ